MSWLYSKRDGEPGFDVILLHEPVWMAAWQATLLTSQA